MVYNDGSFSIFAKKLFKKRKRMFKQKENCVVTIIGSLKGGAGKSTVTNMVAGTLADDYAMQSIGFKKGFKVLVIDADYQTSIYKQRQAELGRVPIPDIDIYDTICLSVNDIQPFLQRESFEVTATDPNGGKYYDIKWQAEDDFDNKVQAIEQQFLQHYESGSMFDNYDFIFFDLVGSIQKNSNVRRAYIYADNLMIPVRPSRYDVRSFIDFVKFIETVVASRLQVAEKYTTNVVSFGNAVKNTNDSKFAIGVIKDLVESNGFAHSKCSLGNRSTYESVTSMNTLFDYFILEKYRDWMKNRKDPRERFRKIDIHEYTSFFLSFCPYFFEVIKGKEIVPYDPESSKSEDVKN